MRYLLPLLCFVISGVALAQVAVNEDTLAESRRINAEMAKLKSETPIALEVEELQRKVNDERRELQDRINELMQQPAWQQYQQRLAELQSERNARLSREREALSEAGRRLYESRHAELRRRAPVELVEAQKLGFDVLNYPPVDGSTSTHPLSVIIASRILNVPYQWHYSEVSGWYRPLNLTSGRPAGSLHLLPDPTADPRTMYQDSLELNLAASRVYADPGEQADPKQQRIARMINSLLAAHTDTHAAHIRLIQGECDLILTARGPSASELKLAEETGVELVAKPIAKDALVFIVNRASLIEDMSQEGLRKLYRESVPTDEMMGFEPPVPAGGIIPLRRERDSGSRELFDELLMKGEQLPEPKDAYASQLYETRSMAGPFNRITQQPNALGYTVYYYEQFMAMSPQTRMIAIDGVMPTPQTIASGEYPLVAPVYAVHRAAQPPRSGAMRLLGWILSPEGQAVVQESGYVPLDPPQK